MSGNLFLRKNITQHYLYSPGYLLLVFDNQLIKNNNNKIKFVFVAFVVHGIHSGEIIFSSMLLSLDVRRRMMASKQCIRRKRRRQHYH